HYCKSTEHGVTRRGFLGGLASTMFWGLALSTDNVLMGEAQAAEVKRQAKRVIILYLGGGASQMETWDPKPGRPTGGPFGAIETSVPGLAISELLPKLATRMQRLAVVRSVNNSALGPDHSGTGVHLGRRPERSVAFPTLAEMATMELARADTKVPPHVELQAIDTFRFETQFGPSLFG